MNYREVEFANGSRPEGNFRVLAAHRSLDGFAVDFLGRPGNAPAGQDEDLSAGPGLRMCSEK